MTARMNTRNRQKPKFLRIESEFFPNKTHLQPFCHPLSTHPCSKLRRESLVRMSWMRTRNARKKGIDLVWSYINIHTHYIYCTRVLCCLQPKALIVIAALPQYVYHSRTIFPFVPFAINRPFGRVTNPFWQRRSWRKPETPLFFRAPAFISLLGSPVIVRPTLPEHTDICGIPRIAFRNKDTIILTRVNEMNH